MAKYHTAMIKDRPYTLDRDHARVGTPQLHESWIGLKTGELRQYSKINNIDWTISTSVEAINKWKEQQLPRHGWNPQRPELRDEYTL